MLFFSHMMHCSTRGSSRPIAERRVLDLRFHRGEHRPTTWSETGKLRRNETLLRNFHRCSVNFVHKCEDIRVRLDPASDPLSEAKQRSCAPSNDQSRQFDNSTSFPISELEELRIAYFTKSFRDFHREKMNFRKPKTKLTKV